MNLEMLREATRAEKFVKAFQNSRDSLLKLGDATARGIDRLVVELRGDIAARLADFNPAEPFASRVLPEIDRSIRDSLDALRRRGGAAVTEAMGEAFSLGGGATAGAFRAAGAQLAVPSVSPEILSSLTGTFENVFTEVTDGLADRIMREVRRSATGLQPASRTISRITDLLKTSEEVKKGLRRRVRFSFQAEEIARTEIGRVYSNAQQAASEQLADSIPKLKKRWLTSPRNTRREHKEAEETYAPGGAKGPIPVKARFRVTDRSRTGRAEFLTVSGRVVRVKSYSRKGRPVTDMMLFPRDPSASPGNVVGCTCSVLEVVPELDEAVDRAAGILTP